MRTHQHRAYSDVWCLANDGRLHNRLNRTPPMTDTVKKIVLSPGKSRNVPMRLFSCADGSSRVRIRHPLRLFPQSPETSCSSGDKKPLANL